MNRKTEEGAIHDERGNAMNNDRLWLQNIIRYGSIFLIPLLFLSRPVLGDEISEEFSRIVPLGEGGRVVLETLGGSVVFSGTDETDVEIEATIVVKAKNEERGREILSDMRIDVDGGANKVKIETIYPKKEGGFFAKIFGSCCYKDVRVNYRLKVPRNIDLSIDGTSTDIVGDDVEGRVKCDITSGDVDVQRIGGSVYVDGTSGNVKVVDIGGDLVVDNTSGEVRGSGVAGDVEIDNTSGTVNLQDLGEDFYLDGTSCDVNLEHVTGDVETDVTSGGVKIIGLGGGILHDGTSGDVEVHFAEKLLNSCNIGTTSGDVSIAVAEESGMNIVLDTASGAISARLPSMEIVELSRDNLNARVMGGGVEVRVETTSEDIHIGLR